MTYRTEAFSIETLSILLLTVLALVSPSSAPTGGGPGDATRVLTYEIYTQAFLNLRLGYGAAIAWILAASQSSITGVLLISTRWSRSSTT